MCIYKQLCYNAFFVDSQIIFGGYDTVACFASQHLGKVLEVPDGVIAVVSSPTLNRNSQRLLRSRDPFRRQSRRLCEHGRETFCFSLNCVGTHVALL